MQKLRPFLSAVIGLTLLVQGFSVAAAVPLATVDEPQVAAMDMPCHGDTQDTAPDSTCPCCEQGCSDMANCAFGHLAAAPSANLQISPAAQSLCAATPRATSAGVPPSLLRPPISSHA